MPNRLPRTDEFEVKEPKKEEVHIYWAPASSYQIANFVPERRLESGRIADREQSIKFMSHIFRTTNPKEIEFIENCSAFDKTENSGQIRKCANMEEASALTRAIKATKSVKTIEAHATSGVNY